MIVDSTAVVAIVLGEPEGDALLRRLSSERGAGIGGPTLAESGLVLERRIGTPGRSLLTRFLHESELAIVPFGEEHWPVAVDAFVRFGKGRHAAGLNFGDCLTYAIARVADEPLLFLGDDFAQTDLVAA